MSVNKIKVIQIFISTLGFQPLKFCCETPVSSEKGDFYLGKHRAKHQSCCHGEAPCHVGIGTQSYGLWSPHCWMLPSASNQEKCKHDLGIARTEERKMTSFWSSTIVICSNICLISAQYLFDSLCKHGEVLSTGSAADILPVRARNSLPEAFKCALSRQFHSWMCCVKGLLHLGAVLSCFEGWRGKCRWDFCRWRLGNPSDCARWSEIYLKRLISWGKLFYLSVFLSWSFTWLCVCSNI